MGAVMYALVTDDTIRSVGALPRAARRLDTGAWVMGLREDHCTDELRAACGYLRVVDAPRPADTDTTTHDRSVELVDGVPTVVWTPRVWTADELAGRTATTNSATIRQQAETALTNNRAFLALATPTAAQNAAQIRALTRQVNGVIRLVLGKLDGTD